MAIIQELLFDLIDCNNPFKNTNHVENILGEIEQEFESDVLVFHGVMDGKLMPMLTNAINYVAKQTGKKDRLTIILNSPGGEYFHVFEFLDKFYGSKIYKELWIVVNGRVCSCAAFFSLFAEKLFVFPDSGFGKSWFGMIDPQCSICENEFTSVFNLLKQNNVSFKPLTVDVVESGEGFIKVDNLYQDETIVKCCNLLNEITLKAFKAIMVHNFQGRGMKQSAIDIINLLMLGLSNEWNHDCLISPDYLRDLNLQLFSIENFKQNKSFGLLNKYNEIMSKHLVQGNLENNANINIEQRSNLLNFYIQTKKTIVF